MRQYKAKRRLAIALLLGLLALAGAACGESDDGGGPASADNDSTETAPAGGGSDPEPPPMEEALAYSQCMRDNGIADYPDPDENEGGFIQMLPEGIDPEDEDFQAAEAACEDLAPSDPNADEPLDAEEFAAAVEYSECMRENGVADFPDPGPDGSINFNEDAADVQRDEFEAAEEACEGLRPDSGGGPDGGDE